jgi:DNA-binding response OmpR family regulator
MPTKVLIVDDEQTIAQTLRIILQQNGFAVKATYDGDTAVNIAMDWRPDIFLADIVMPGMSGYEAALQIRAVLPDCRVLLFSGHLLSADEVPLSGMSEDLEFLSKPIHPDQLLDKLLTRAAVLG